MNPTVDIGQVQIDVDTSLSFFTTGPVGLILSIILGVFGFILAITILLYVIRYFVRKPGGIGYEFEKVVLHVALPKVSSASDEKSTEKTIQQIQEEISLTETIFGSIGGLKAQKGFKAWMFGRSDEVSFEVVLFDEKINFYIAVPRYLHQYIEQQIHGQYPEAHIEEIQDYNIFNPKSVIIGSYLTFKNPYVYPIKTYKKLDGDPMNAVLNSFGKFEKEEGAAIQILVRSAPKKWRKWGVKAVEKMHSGKKMTEAIAITRPTLLPKWSSITGFFKTSKKDDIEKQHKLSQGEEEGAKAIEEKASKAGLDVNMRVIVSSTNAQKAQLRLNDINNAFSQFNIYQYGNSFKASLLGSLKKFVESFIHRDFNEKALMVLNTEELASLYHLPLSFTDAPNIDWLKAKKSGTPLNMPQDGLVLGYNQYRGKQTEIRLKEKDALRHMYIIGMTGTGKSYFMTGLVIQRILDGEGVCVIDPHGDLVDDILEHTPKERAEDIILFDPANVERPMALNMLEYETEEQKLFVVDTILQIFDKLYDLKSTGGPMFEQYMRNTLLLIMDDPESGMTLAEVSKVLADEEFRKMKLSRCKTPVVKDFWEKEAQKAGGEASLQNMVPYITSKLTPFIANDLMRPIISQQKSSFGFRDAMNSKKIILVKLSKGKIGDLNANLLGMIMVNKILMAALGRADIDESQRVPFYLFIDEFQNFLTDSIEIILSEARKYKLSLTIAHQYLGQLVKGGESKFKDAIFGNVGTKVAFRIGVDDAETMAREFSPIFTEYDFLNVPKYNAFVKLLIDNANPPPFNMATYEFNHFADGDHERGRAIAELSMLKYGRDRAIVESEIRQRSRQLDSLSTDKSAPSQPPDRQRSSALRRRQASRLQQRSDLMSGQSPVDPAAPNQE